MYLRHFGLAAAPFSIAPDPRYLFLSERHREALAHLVYGLDAGGGVVLLTGAIGAGKTTVFRAFLEQLPARCRLAYVFNPKLSALELLVTVAEEFGLDPAGRGLDSVKACTDALNRFLLERHAAGEQAVLVIDEAQNLDAPVLEQLRLLTNLETAERKLLQIVLIGQPELRGRLAEAGLEQLAQRIVARYHLEALDAAETRAYVAHRLAVAGAGPAPLFDAGALRALHRLGGGVPRRLNLIADRALLAAYAAGRLQVDARLLRRAAAEVAGQAPTRPFPGRVPTWTALGLAVGLALGWAGARLPRPVDDRPATPAARLSPDDGPRGAASAPGPAQAASPGRAAASAMQPADAEAGAEAQAWRTLAQAWQPALVLREDEAPCPALAAQGWACLVLSTRLDDLRRLDRPAWLALHDGPPRRLLALGPHTVRLGGLDGAAAETWPLERLAAQWTGRVATLWQAPPGYTGGVIVPGRGPAGRWLEARLRAQAGASAPAASADALVRAFQARHGLPEDGLAGPLTLLHLARAGGEPAPRLAVLP